MRIKFHFYFHFYYFIFFKLYVRTYVQADEALALGDLQLKEGFRFDAHLNFHTACVYYRVMECLVPALKPQVHPVSTDRTYIINSSILFYSILFYSFLICIYFFSFIFGCRHLLPSFLFSFFLIFLLIF